jgi:hypothetical protein
VYTHSEWVQVSAFNSEPAGGFSKVQRVSQQSQKGEVDRVLSRNFVLGEAQVCIGD